MSQSSPTSYRPVYTCKFNNYHGAVQLHPYIDSESKCNLAVYLRNVIKQHSRPFASLAIIMRLSSFTHNIIIVPESKTD